MPQMKPMNWLSLFFIFCIINLLFNILNYFILNLYNNKKKMFMKKKHLQIENDN